MWKKMTVESRIFGSDLLCPSDIQINFAKENVKLLDLKAYMLDSVKLSNTWLWRSDFTQSAVYPQKFCQCLQDTSCIDSLLKILDNKTNK